MCICISFLSFELCGSCGNPRRGKSQGRPERGRCYSLHLEPLRESMSLRCCQRTHIAYAEVKGKKRRRPQVLEYLDNWRSEAKINKKSWVNVLWTSSWKRAGDRHMWGHQWTIHLSTESGEDKKKELPKRKIWANCEGSSQTQNSRTTDSLKLPIQQITEQPLWANLYWQLEFILAQCFESLDRDVFDLVLDALEFELLLYSPQHRECVYCVLLTITKQFRRGSLYNNIVFVNILSWLT